MEIVILFKNKDYIIMTEEEVIEKLRESIVFETAWLFNTMPTTNKEKEIMIEAVKVIWNRSIGRAGFGGPLSEISVDEKDFKEISDYLNSKSIKLVAPKETTKSDDDQSKD